MMPFATMNQMSLNVPQGNEGLGVPWGQAMFNLPRYQMPGSTLNVGGQVPMPQGQMQPTEMNFSITRTASSDPVANIIKDIQNPLGGTNVNFGQQNTLKDAQQNTLKGAMLQSAAPDAYPPLDPGALAGLGFPGYSAMQSPFALKSRMIFA